MRPKDADGMANSVDPDQPAPLVEQSVFGLELFAQTCLSAKLRIITVWNVLRVTKQITCITLTTLPDELLL